MSREFSRAMLEAISAECGAPVAVVRNVLRAQRRVVTAEVLKGGRVAITGLAELQMKHVGARPGYNFRTGEKLVAPPCMRVTARAARELRALAKEVTE